MNLEKQMYELVEDYLRSGKTQREYSLQAGIGKAKFNYWVCKYKRQQEDPSVGFIKIETASAMEQDQELEILYPNGVRLKAGGADLSLISQLIRLY